jgi:hypothetical protein
MRWVSPDDRRPPHRLTDWQGRARHRQEAARILRDEVCNRSDDGIPPLELSARTEQILASRDWLPPMKSASWAGVLVAMRIVKVF